jgi:hypothetical protein
MIIIINFVVNFLASVILFMLCCDYFSGDLSPLEASVLVQWLEWLNQA